MPCAAPILAAPNFGVCAASDPKGKWKGQVAMPGFRWDACPRVAAVREDSHMRAAIIAEAIGLLKARPPSSTGLSRKSPTVAPSGRVRMKAAQNSVTREMLVHQ